MNFKVINFEMPFVSSYLLLFKLEICLINHKHLINFVIHSALFRELMLLSTKQCKSFTPGNFSLGLKEKALSHSTVT